MDKLLATLATWFWVSSNWKLLCLWKMNGYWGRSGILELEKGVKNQDTDYDVINPVKSNCDVIANFS